MDKRPIVGLMVNDLGGSYQYGHWLGLDAQAAAAGCDLISFNGGEVGSPDVTKRMRNEAFRLVNPQDVDALVLMAPAVANSLTPEQILAFVQNLSPLPLVIAGMEIQKSTGLPHPVGFFPQPQTSQQTGSADRNGSRTGVDPNHGSYNQIFLKFGFGRMSQPWHSSESYQQHCGQAAPRHVVIVLPGRNR